MNKSTVWITGGKGFIGRHVARWVAAQGYSVAGIGHGLWPDADAANWSFASWLNGEVDASNLSQLARMHGLPQAVIHLAGGSSVGASFHNPLEDFRRTAGTTANLLEWLRLESPDTRLVVASSAAVYGTGHAGTIQESTALSPCSPYGMHKTMMEMLCRSYVEDFGLNVAAVRLFSVYGAGLEKQLIWDLCCKLASGSKTVTLGGTGREIRDWLHVSDAARLLWLATSACNKESWIVNGGTGIASTIQEVADSICRIWGEGQEAVFSGIARKGDPLSLVASVELAHRLGFEPSVKLSSGLAEMVGWFRARK
jgi:UDP-glucose 4-epimerase